MIAIQDHRQVLLIKEKIIIKLKNEKKKNTLTTKTGSETDAYTVYTQDSVVTCV